MLAHCESLAAAGPFADPLNVSRTKIAEERLGNVRTSQAFAGEILEVHRYNTQVRKIFELGKKESLISATFFSSTGFMGNMTILTLLYIGGGMVSSGKITIGELTSFLMYTAYAGSSLFGLSSFYSELMKVTFPPPHENATANSAVIGCRRGLQTVRTPRPRACIFANSWRACHKC